MQHPRAWTSCRHRYRAFPRAAPDTTIHVWARKEERKFGQEILWRWHLTGHASWNYQTDYGKGNQRSEIRGREGERPRPRVSSGGRDMTLFFRNGYTSFSLEVPQENFFLVPPHFWSCQYYLVYRHITPNSASLVTSLSLLICVSNLPLALSLCGYFWLIQNKVPMSRSIT
jgi:hypothetical protein